MDPNTGRPPTGCDADASNNTWRCRGYGAATCQVYPCVRSYNVSVENGAVKETVVSTAGSLSSYDEGNLTSSRVFGRGGGPNSYDSAFYSTVNKTCLHEDDRVSLRKAGYPVDDTSSVWMPYRFFPYPHDDFRYSLLTPNASAATKFPQTMIQRSCVYIMSADATGFGDIFDGTLVRNNLLGTGIVGSWTGPQILQTIYNWGNTSFERVELTFQNISDSLTSYIRLHPNDTSPLDNARLNQPTLGVAWHTRTCLQIEWAWLTLLAALVCLSVLFLVLQLESYSLSNWRLEIITTASHLSRSRVLARASSRLGKLRRLRKASWYGGACEDSICQTRHGSRQVSVSEIRIEGVN